MDINYYINYDLPVPYRNINIYPVTVKEYLLFNAFGESLTVEKNIIPDVKIITMTNLEYLFYSTLEKKEITETTHPYLLWFDRVLHICLKDDKSFESLEESIKRYKLDENNKPFFIIGDEKYTSEDFDKIKIIICNQNLMELPDRTISKEVRDSLEEARKYKEKLSGQNKGSLEDYMISLSIATGWTLEYIYSMTIRKFIKSIKRLDGLIHYKIYLSASMSGMVTFKDTSFIKHWLLGSDDDDKYKDVTMDLETIQSKVSMESAKN